MQPNKTFNLKTIVTVGLLAALVFALSYIQIQIPVGAGDNTRIHLGNIMCLLAGLLFGPLVGGLAAGFGSMLFDLTNPLYISEFWITFLTKFAMGWLAGWLATRPLKKLPAVPRSLLGGLGGQLCYIVLYLGKTAVMQHFVYGIPWPATWVVVATKGAVSGINGLLAVVACTLLAPPLAAALKSAGFLPKRPSRPA